MGTQSLQQLFAPTSIAVVGASGSAGKAGHEMLKAVKNFPGNVFPVNPAGGQILGLQVFTSVSEIPTQVDLVIVALPASLCKTAVEDSIAAGAGAIMIISGGFAEAGSEGSAIEQSILQACKANGIRVLGPNTSGFANPGLGLTANFAPGMDDLTPGPVAIISQSGAITLALAAIARDKGVGVSLAVGIGNGQDVSTADAIEYLANDPSTAVIAVYLEGISKGRQLFEAIKMATRTKPVVAYAVGKADIGEFAQSHTGNLIGSYALKCAALEQAGAILTDSIESLVEAASLFTQIRLTPDPQTGVGLLTGQAGPAMIISDHLKSNGISMPRLNDSTVAAIDKLLPPMTYIEKPVDTGRPGESFAEIVRLVSEDESIGLLLTFALHEPAAVDPATLFPENKSSSGTPLLFATAGRAEETAPVIEALTAKGIPSFASPDMAARGVRSLVDDARKAWRVQQAPAKPDSLAGLPTLEHTPNEFESKRILAKIGIPSPAGYLCNTREEAIVAFSNLSHPCVAKVVSPEITHKTEVGGVCVGIDSQESLEDAISQLDAIEAAGEIQYLVEEMAPPGLELIVGATRDESFGPTVLVGLGGTIAEALEDVSIRLAPITTIDAEEMLLELRGAALLNGWRGQKAVDKKRICNAVVSVASLIHSHSEISEIDINPIRVYPDGLLALDSLILVSESQET